jgi:hypothetical protein
MKIIICLILCGIVLYFGIRHIITLWRDRKSILTKASNRPLFHEGTKIEINGNRYVYRKCRNNNRDLKRGKITLE